MTVLRGDGFLLRRWGQGGERGPPVAACVRDRGVAPVGLHALVLRGYGRDVPADLVGALVVAELGEDGPAFVDGARALLLVLARADSAEQMDVEGVVGTPELAAAGTALGADVVLRGAAAEVAAARREVGHGLGPGECLLRIRLQEEGERGAPSA